MNSRCLFGFPTKNAVKDTRNSGGTVHVEYPRVSKRLDTFDHRRRLPGVLESEVQRTRYELQGTIRYRNADHSQFRWEISWLALPARWITQAWQTDRSLRDNCRRQLSIPAAVFIANGWNREEPSEIEMFKKKRKRKKKRITKRRNDTLDCELNLRDMY